MTANDILTWLLGQDQCVQQILGQARQYFEDEIAGKASSASVPTSTRLQLFRVEGGAGIVRILLQVDGEWSVQQLIEASIHLPARGHKWIAGRWEREARAERKARRLGPQPASQRVARRETDPPSDSPGGTSGLLSQLEVATILRISERATRQAEKSALAKLRANPIIRQLIREYFGRDIGETLGGVNEHAEVLNASDIEALLGLAQTTFERRVIKRLLRLIGAGRSPLAE